MEIPSASNDRPSRPHHGEAKLRVLSLDGGGIKGLTTLLILRRIMRTVKIEGKLDNEPRPCDLFDMICGTSTGGLIAIMLGRLGMTVDQCIAEYKRCGETIFGQGSRSKAARLFKTAQEKPWYSVDKLQEAVKATIVEAKHALDEGFEESDPQCKTFVCVTRVKTGAAEVLRNYATTAADQEDFACHIWEPGCATAAAPFYFDHFKLEKNGEIFTDGGLKRNNPIREMIAECHRVWPDRNFGCVVSLGTGWPKTEEIPKRVDKFFSKCLDMLTDSERIAAEFEAEKFCKDLTARNAYFRFNVQQGMADIELADYKEQERMSALTNQYLARCEGFLRACAKSLLDPGEDVSQLLIRKNEPLPVELCQNHRPRPGPVTWLQHLYAANAHMSTRAAIWGLGGTGKTQIAIEFANAISQKPLTFWISAESPETFMLQYGQIYAKLQARAGEPTDDHGVAGHQLLLRTKTAIERSRDPITLIIDNADDVDMFRKPTLDQIDLGAVLPNAGFTLFTTRDARFLGSIVPIANSLRVKIMNTEEAVDLFMHSLPPELVQREDQQWSEHLKWLLDQIGHLPLAIAQAGATMRECSIGLAQFVQMFKDKAIKTKILKEPLHELKDHPQSVLVTWEVTFSMIKLSSEHAANLLLSLGYFHWINIPMQILRYLSCFTDLDSLEFAKAVGILVNFAIVEKSVNEEGLEELSLHPLVHFWIRQRLSVDKQLPLLQGVLNLVNSVFDFTTYRTQSWHTYMLSHALEVINASEDDNLESPAVVRLLQFVAQYFHENSYDKTALRLIEKAEELSMKVWPVLSSSRYLIQAQKARILLDCGKLEQAAVAYRAMYDCLPQLADDGVVNKERERAELLMIALHHHTMQFVPCDVLLFREIERLETSALTAHHLNQIADCMLLHSKLDLAEHFAQLSSDKVAAEQRVDLEAELATLNVQGHIKEARGLQDQALEIYISIFERSLEIMTGRRASFWVYCLNVCALLGREKDFVRLEKYALRALEHWDSSLEGIALAKATLVIDLLGASLQRQGQTQEARALHSFAMARPLRTPTELSNATPSPRREISLRGATVELCAYNICMSYVREEDWQNAVSFRSEHEALVQKAEAHLGTLEERRDSFLEDKEMYNTALGMLQKQPEGFNLDSEWQQQHKDALERAILFYGPLRRAILRNEDPKAVEDADPPEIRTVASSDENVTGKPTSRTPNQEYERKMKGLFRKLGVDFPRSSRTESSMEPHAP